MKRFPTKFSPEKGKRLKYIPGNITSVKVIKANPGVLLAVAEKKWNNNIPGFTRFLTAALFDNADYVKPLNIVYVANRMVPGSTTNEPMITNGGWNWHVYLRLVQDSEFDTIDLVARKWGQDIVDVFNNTIVPTKFSRVEKFEYGGIKDWAQPIRSLSSYIVQNSVVKFCEQVYSDSIESGSFFADESLMDELFPGVEDPKILFH